MFPKKLYDLTKSDLEEFPIWYFPMDELFGDELSIMPFLEGSALEYNYQMIVKTEFMDSDGVGYIGYIYWRGTNIINECQPTLFLDENNCISFWNGIVKPKWECEGEKQQSLRKVLPISFKSEECGGLEAIKGVLLGLYYFDERRNISYID